MVFAGDMNIFAENPKELTKKQTKNLCCQIAVIAGYKVIIQKLIAFFPEDFIYLSVTERDRERKHKQGSSRQREKEAPC